ncbi:response regulator [Candidatus Woesearchaeota archaeon]|jgi:DNA-binding NtrC family response regulator|nr:response regulator [Candidatus Woesearchaeota archaeon]MBT6518689.1 response regulator [Candidatus Woesearchaeota archaeon]MBT7368389.1 response regulator [Candidatus Woesearchaeota archaeon]
MAINNPLQKSEESIKLELLIADDDSTNRKLYKIFLGKEYNITLAKSGQECIALLETGFRPDHLLLDYRMFPLTGVDVLRYCHEQHIDATPIICSGTIDEVKTDLAATPYIEAKLFEKPVNPTELKEYLANASEEKEFKDFSDIGIEEVTEVTQSSYL